jgi:hypothetical protein
VYRVNHALFLTWLDAASRAGPAVQLAEGDVGAPSVALVDNTAIVAWAERASASEAYRIAVWSAALGAAPASTHHLIAGHASAFAPGLATRPGEVLVTWMEGDDGRHGVVRLARVPVAALGTGLGTDVDVSAASTLSPLDGNARDPEVSSRAGEVTLVWSEFSKGSPDGRVQVRHLDCPP